MLLKSSHRFEQLLARHGAETPTRRAPTTLQVNLGGFCNQTCRHCHVDAGPHRTEAMDAVTASRVLEVLAGNPSLTTLDVTGGAPELNPHFRHLVDGARRLRRNVMVRCNLTVLHEPGQEDTPGYFADRRVTVVASLPCYTAENVDAQRGGGVFDLSIRALRSLNDLGYGTGEGDETVDGLRLHLVYNPLGPVLPPDQQGLTDDYRRRLAADFGIVFDRLLALTNMPIHRFAEDLRRQGRLGAYHTLLEQAFNLEALDGLMCRDLISVNWDGSLSDCDFNQMLGLPLGEGPATIFDLEDVRRLTGAAITTADHCLGCTAGQGSSCGGALSTS